MHWFHWHSVTIFDLVKLVYCIMPLPSILIVVDSGFKITTIWPVLHTTGFSNVNFKGEIDENFAALICNPIFTKQP